MKWNPLSQSQQVGFQVYIDDKGAGACDVTAWATQRLNTKQLNHKVVQRPIQLTIDYRYIIYSHIYPLKSMKPSSPSYKPI